MSQFFFYNLRGIPLLNSDAVYFVLYNKGCKRLYFLNKCSINILVYMYMFNMQRIQQLKITRHLKILQTSPFSLNSYEQYDTPLQVSAFGLKPPGPFQTLF